MSTKTLNILGYIVKAGIILLPLTAFIVSSTMFFPYITGKNFAFRITVEILLALWVVLAIFKREYRPAISPILYAVTITVVVLALATMFGANPYRSFWSNYERMEGLLGHLHLFAYFLVLISVFKGAADWKKMFYSLAATGAAMALYGYLQFYGVLAISQQSGPRVDGTFGNASYMAIFMVFQVFLALFLFFQSEQRWLKALFAALFIFEVPVIFLTATRGAILGLLGGLVLFGLLLVIFNKSRSVKKVSIGVIFGIILLAGAFWLARNTDFVKNNYVLTRFSDLSLQERTVESRFTIWGMSWQGFKEYPLLGYGIENYNLVFNKYYEPKLWRQEPWFDRSHNVFFDWLIAAGALGLLAYLSIFVSVLYVLWKKYVQERGLSGSIYAPAIFTGLFAAYFFHNFFVFDNLISYYLFFTVIGFIHFQGTQEAILEESKQKSRPAEFGPAHMAAAVSVIVAMSGVMYFVNVKPVLASQALLNALRDVSTEGQNVDLILRDFDKVFAYRSFGTGEAREQLSGYANNIVKSEVPMESKIKVLTAAIKEMEDQAKNNPNDARTYLFLSSLYGYGGKTTDTLVTLNKALELSPKKQQIYFLLADVYISLNQNDKAVEMMRIAYNLDQSYDAAALGLAMVEIINDNQDNADALLKKHFGTIVVADPKLLTAYARVGRYDRVRDVWLSLIEKDPSNVQYHISLAATYLKLENRAMSVKELEKAIVLSPEFKKQGEALISEIKAGRNP
ncbi:MAG: O-antigen ligase family protein [Candidatus Niyogibacteria bacterium]|nr:O-antigen ligase family protein [Candidatus Niyogibacteria bacterium]